MNDTTTKPVLLYAEDDLDDFEMLKEAVMHLTDAYDVMQAKNGVEVQSFLETAKTHPCLIVLDLNMPVMDGKETLQWLKAHEAYHEIPTMVFTTSSREDDIKLCQSYNCTFFRKPTLYRDLLHIAQIMLELLRTQITTLHFFPNGQPGY